MEAGEYGLTRGTWVFARCLEVVALAGLLWIQWCVLGRADFFVFFFLFLFSSNAHGLLQVRIGPPCLIYLYTTCVFCHER